MDSGLKKHILEYKSKMQAAPIFQDANNPEIEIRAKRVGDKSSECVHIIANEPSLAFYRIQEHVRRSLPALVEKKHEVEDIHQQIQGASFDTEYAINAVNDMEKSAPHFKNVRDLLKNALFIKQQLQYEQTRRQQLKQKPNMYRPLSMMSRTQTLDISVDANASSGGAARDANAEFSQSNRHRAPTRSLEGSPQTGRARSSSLSGKS